MAITFVAAGASVTGANPVVPVPTGYAAGDLLIIVATSSTANPTTPSGWTLLTSTLANTADLAIFYKTATASEASVTLSIAGANTRAVMVGYRGAGTIETVPAFAAGTSTSATPNTVTTTASNDFIVSIYAGSVNAANTWTANGSTTSRVNNASSISVNGLLIADELQTSAGVSTARTATLSLSNVWSSIAIAFKPAGGTAYFVTCIANLNRLRTTGSLNTFSLNAVAVDDSLYSNGVSSTSTLATPRLFSKAITYLSTSAATIKKGVLKLLSLVSTTTTSPLLKSLKKTFATVTSVSTTTLSRAIAHALAVLSTSIALIFKAITHPLSTVTSSSSASVFKIAAKSFVTALTSTALVIKAVFVTFITLGNKYVITGGLNGKPLNILALNTDTPVYTTTTGVTSASTVSTNSVFKKLITYLQTSSSSIVINFRYLLSLLFTSTNTVALVKNVVAIRSSVTNSVASIVKAVRISLINFSDVTLVVISGIGKHLVGISEIVPSTASINKAVRKILGFASTSSVQLYFGYFRNLIATVSVSIVSTIKKVSKTLAATTVVSTITLLSVKAFFKILSVTQSAVSTLSIGKVFLRIVSLVVTSTLSLAKGVKAIRAVVQTPIVVLLKPSTRLLLLVTTVVATVVSFLYRLAANSKDIVYVPTKRIALQLAGFISILVRLKKTGVTASKQDNLNG